MADKKGLLTYRIAIPLEELESAFEKKYGIERFPLEGRVVYTHGVPTGPPLPALARSLRDAPASVSVPRRP